LRIALYAIIKPYVNRKLSGREDIRTNGDIKAGCFFTLKGLVEVPKSVLNALDHTPVDRHILRSGSLTVQPEVLDQFNKAIQCIEHVF
ncbi:MAG: hypothetical protein P8X79_18180, partial [Reinekea sp.]